MPPKPVLAKKQVMLIMPDRSHQFSSLRRRHRPYVVFAVPIGAVSVFLTYLGIAKHDTSSLVSAVVVWLGFVPMWAIMYRYAIFWNDSEIRMRAFGIPSATLRISDIQRIAYERSDVRQLLGVSRPSPRISIYGPLASRRSGVIDISLRHFELKSIRDLLGAVRHARNDLAIPTLGE
jgi:hypothetical protein